MAKNDTYGKNLEIEFQKLNKTNNYVLSDFKCEYANIQKYFREDAVNDKSATTYIFVNVKENPEIVTAMTINCSIIDLSDNEILPAIEISYFATSDRYRKMSFTENRENGTLSFNIMLFCINYIKDMICSQCAADVIVLYSVPTAVDFYKRAGFFEFENFMARKDNPYLEGCLPMYLPLH